MRCADDPVAEAKLAKDAMEVPVGAVVISVGAEVQARPRLESPRFQKFKLMKRNVLLALST